MEVIKTAHSVYRLEYYVVWVCKYRRRVLNPGVQAYFLRVLTKLLRSMPGVTLETIGFDGDHLHMLMVIPPKYSIRPGRRRSSTSITNAMTSNTQTGSVFANRRNRRHGHVCPSSCIPFRVPITTDEDSEPNGRAR